MEHADAFMIRLAFLYLAIGVGIVYLQLANSPCRYPVVLDDGGPPISPPLDIERIGTDRAYQWGLGKDVIFWLPRLVDLVGIRGMPFPDFLFGRVCKDEQRPATAAATPATGDQPAGGVVVPAMPPPVADAPEAVTPLAPPTQKTPLAGYTPPTVSPVPPPGATPATERLPPIPIERPRQH